MKTFLLALACAVTVAVQAQLPGIAFPPDGGSSLDRAAFTQWVDAQETPIAESAAKGGPIAVVWTAKAPGSRLR